MANQELLLSSLQWRYAAKSFAPAKIPAAEWSVLEQALVLTPSSYGLQPWKFLVVQDEATREKLKSASWNQRQVSECSHYVVFASRTEMDEAYVDRYLKSVAQTRQQAVESLAGLKKSIMNDVVHGPRGMWIGEWAARQSYIALGSFMTAAAVMQIDACPMEGLDPAKYDEILGLKGSGYATTVACATGYRNPQDRFVNAKKVRFPLEEMVQRF